jgi:hypothetical protein
LRILKSEVSAMSDDDASKNVDGETPAAAPAAAVSAPVVTVPATPVEQRI